MAVGDIDRVGLQEPRLVRVCEGSHSVGDFSPPSVCAVHQQRREVRHLQIHIHLSPRRYSSTVHTVACKYIC